MNKCRICDVPDEQEICAPCLEMEMRIDNFIACEPEKAVSYLEKKLKDLKQELFVKVSAGSVDHILHMH